MHHLNIRRLNQPAGSVGAEAHSSLDPGYVQLPQKQRDSIADAEKIMTLVKTEQSEDRRMRTGRILVVSETEETIPIALHPERVRPGFTYDCATINHHTVRLYRQGRLACAMGGQSNAGQTLLSTESSWHVRLGLASGELLHPADMLEEICAVAPPVVPDVGRAVDLTDAKGSASMESFASFVTQAVAGLRATGREV